jgi:hypothetical protein
MDLPAVLRPPLSPYPDPDIGALPAWQAAWRNLHWPLLLVSFSILGLSGFASRQIFGLKCFPAWLRERPIHAAMTVINQISNGAIAYQGIAGFMQNWMATDGRFSTWEDRIYKPVESLTVVLHIQLSQQIFTLAYVAAFGDVATGEMYAHHVAVVLVSFFNLTPYMQYYGIFLGAMIEISSIPLCIMDFCKYYQEASEAMPLVRSSARYTFVVLFIVLRIVAWYPVMYLTQLDVYAYVQSGRNDVNFVMVLNQLAFLILTILQAVWGVKVIRGLFTALGCIRKKDKKKEA